MNAETTLTDAIQRVAEAARDASDNAIPHDSGWVLVYADDMKAIREALAGWTDASNAFMASIGQEFK